MTIKSYPADTCSVNNEMLFVVSDAKASDPVTYPDYVYVLDVYVASTLIERILCRPDPSYDMGIIDVSRALQPYCSYGLNAGSNSVDYTVRLAYQVKIGEQYGGTLYTNIVEDVTDRYAFESYAERPFTTSSVLTTAGIASNMPDVIYHHREALWHLLPFFNNVSGSNDLAYQQCSEGGTVLQSDTLSMSGHVANTIRQFNMGEDNLDILSNAAYGQVAWPNSDTIILTIKYLDSCKYTPLILAWLNPYGGYDSQTFGFVSKKSIELSKKDFSQVNYRINASGEVSYQSNNVFYGSKRGFAATTKTRVSLTSHLLKAEEFTWLADLFKSTDIYLFVSASLTPEMPLIGGGKFVPVTITRSNYDYLNKNNSTLVPLQFDVELTDIFNSQFL